MGNDMFCFCFFFKIYHDTTLELNYLSNSNDWFTYFGVNIHGCADKKNIFFISRNKYTYPLKNISCDTKYKKYLLKD